jgi:hypothetical protein
MGILQMGEDTLQEEIELGASWGSRNSWESGAGGVLAAELKTAQNN